MKKKWKLITGIVLLIAGLGFFAVPWYNCVFWVSSIGVVFIILYLIDSKRETLGK
jgi:uncharacterized membrane protein HdeD (DUF308 family)